MNSVRSFEIHYFNALCQLQERPSQTYIVEISLPSKTISYILKEKLIHSLPFHHVMRLSSSLSSFTLHVRGTRLGESVSILHMVNEVDRPALAAFITSHCLQHEEARLQDTDTSYNEPTSTTSSSSQNSSFSNPSPHTPVARRELASSASSSPYPNSLAIFHEGPVTKKGRWGGDAQRYASILSSRLVLHRNATATYPLTVFMMSEISTVERKGNKRIKLVGQDREWEFGFDEAQKREEFMMKLETERLESRLRLEAWKKEGDEREKERQQRRERERAELEANELQKQKQRHTINHHVSLEERDRSPSAHQNGSHSLNEPVEVSPKTPAERLNKRRTMPSPSINAIAAHVMSSKNKRSSLSIRTRGNNILMSPSGVAGPQSPFVQVPNTSSPQSAHILPQSPSLIQWRTGTNGGATQQAYEEAVSPLPFSSRSPQQAPYSPYSPQVYASSAVANMPTLMSPIHNGGSLHSPNLQPAASLSPIVNAANASNSSQSLYTPQNLQRINSTPIANRSPNASQSNTLRFTNQISPQMIAANLSSQNTLRFNNQRSIATAEDAFNIATNAQITTPPSMPAYNPPPVPAIKYDSLTSSQSQMLSQLQSLYHLNGDSPSHSDATFSNPVSASNSRYTTMNSQTFLPPSNVSIDNNANSWRYTIFVQGFDEPIGQISVLPNPSFSLAHLRQLMIEELDDVPDEFNFCDIDPATNLLVPISIKQERTRSLEFVPSGSLYIRVKPGRTSVSEDAKSVSNSAISTSNNPMNMSHSNLDTESLNSVIDYEYRNSASSISALNESFQRSSINQD